MILSKARLLDILCQKKKSLFGRIYGIYVIIALKKGNLCLLCTYKNDVAVRVLTVTPAEGLVAWARCQPYQHSCEALEDCCEKTANRNLLLLCSCAFELWFLPMVSQPNYVASTCASSLAPPWFCPRSLWTQVPGLI